jgi:uncharacterized membrane protein
MNQFIVVVFPDEMKAYEGWRALKELHAEGGLTVYSSGVIRRDAAGILLREAQTEGPVGTGGGALLGALAGLAGGPVAGVLGTLGGTFFGALHDLFNMGVSEEFLEWVMRELSPGKSAVVAEVEEEWVSPLDARMESIGGHVIREWRCDFIDDAIQKRIDRHKAELAHRRTERAAARAEKIETMKNEVSKAEQKLRAAAEHASERVRRYREESDAKIQALESQAKKASADAKSRINARISEIRAEQKQRLAKLEQARKLAQEALTP